jgi:hypothetical protein
MYVPSLSDSTWQSNFRYTLCNGGTQFLCWYPAARIPAGYLMQWRYPVSLLVPGTQISAIPHVVEVPSFSAGTRHSNFCHTSCSGGTQFLCCYPAVKFLPYLMQWRYGTQFLCWYQAARIPAIPYVMEVPSFSAGTRQPEFLLYLM